MPFIAREDLKIVGVFANPQPGFAEEELADDSPELLDFTNQTGDYAPVKSLNQQLEEAFLTVLPLHLGQPYLTDSVIGAIMSAKVAVIDANLIDPSGMLAKATIRGLALPSEMEDDRQTLLELIP